MTAMHAPTTEAELDELLSRPTPGLLDDLARTPGDILVMVGKLRDDFEDMQHKLLLQALDGITGVRTAAVAPGIVHTEAWESKYGLDPALVSRVIPLLRLQRPDEIAALVGFLISAAGDYITGQTLVADGGWDLVGPAAALAGVDFTS